MDDDDARAIEADIHRRREELALTLEALQQQAAPDRLAADVAVRALREGGALLDRASGALRRNPVAGVLIFAGIAALLLGPKGDAKRAQHSADGPPPEV
jgi:hypothetical protein